MNKTFTNAKSTFSYYFTLENIKIIQTTCQQTSDMWTELVCNIFVCDVILNEHDCDDLILRTKWNNRNQLSYKIFICDVILNEHDCDDLVFETKWNKWNQLSYKIFICDVILNEHDCGDLILRTKWNKWNQLFYKIFICDVILNEHDWMILFFELNGINEINSRIKYLFVMLFWMCMSVMILFLKLNVINDWCFICQCKEWRNLSSNMTFTIFCLCCILWFRRYSFVKYEE